MLQVIDFVKERVTNTNEFLPMTHYFFEEVSEFEMEPILKKWNLKSAEVFSTIIGLLSAMPQFDASSIESVIKEEIARSGISFGAVFPALRVALTGGTKGPDLFRTIELIGQEEVVSRLEKGLQMYELNKIS